MKIVMETFWETANKASSLHICTSLIGSAQWACRPGEFCVSCELTLGTGFTIKRERDERKYAGGYAVDTIIIIDSFNFQFVK